MEPQAPSLDLARSPEPDDLDFWGRLLLKGLASGWISTKAAEAALTDGYDAESPAFRARLDAYAKARCIEPQVTAGAHTAGVFADLLEMPPEPTRSRPRSNQRGGRSQGPATDSQRALAQVAALRKLNREDRLVEVNLRPTLYRGAQIARALLAEALAVLPSNPSASAHWAKLASLSAGTGRSPSDNPKELETLALRANLYVANASRARGNLSESERLFAGAAIGAARLHVTDPHFWAEAKAFRASLYRAQRRFADALREGRVASAFFKAMGERRWQVTQLSQLAFVHELVGDYSAAISAYREALSDLVEPSEAGLRFSLRHGEILALARASRFSEAWESYLELLPEYRQFPEHRQRQMWVEGLIHSGFGNALDAEASFRAAREGFLSDEQPYAAALVTLDLSLFLLDQNRSEEVLPLAASMGRAFEGLGVARETLASWAIFQAAAERREVTRAVAESMVQRLAEEREGERPRR